MKLWNLFLISLIGLVILHPICEKVAELFGQIDTPASTLVLKTAFTKKLWEYSKLKSTNSMCTDVVHLSKSKRRLIFINFNMTDLGTMTDYCYRIYSTFENDNYNVMACVQFAEPDFDDKLFIQDLFTPLFEEIASILNSIEKSGKKLILKNKILESVLNKVDKDNLISGPNGYTYYIRDNEADPIQVIINNGNSHQNQISFSNSYSSIEFLEDKYLINQSFIDKTIQRLSEYKGKSPIFDINFINKTILSNKNVHLIDLSSECKPDNHSYFDCEFEKKPIEEFFYVPENVSPNSFGLYFDMYKTKDIIENSHRKKASQINLDKHFTNRYFLAYGLSDIYRKMYLEVHEFPEPLFKYVLLKFVSQFATTEYLVFLGEDFQANFQAITDENFKTYYSFVENSDNISEDSRVTMEGIIESIRISSKRSLCKISAKSIVKLYTINGEDLLVKECDIKDMKTGLFAIIELQIISKSSKYYSIKIYPREFKPEVSDRNMFSVEFKISAIYPLKYKFIVEKLVGYALESINVKRYISTTENSYNNETQFEDPAMKKRISVSVINNSNKFNQTEKSTNINKVPVFKARNETHSSSKLKSSIEADDQTNQTITHFTNKEVFNPLVDSKKKPHLIEQDQTLPMQKESVTKIQEYNNETFKANNLRRNLSDLTTNTIKKNEIGELKAI